MIAVSVGKSLKVIASTVILPKPGIPKKDSNRSEPVTKNGRLKITLVKIGIIAFLNRCLNKIEISPKPFERAVRM